MIGLNGSGKFKKMSLANDIRCKLIPGYDPNVISDEPGTPYSFSHLPSDIEPIEKAIEVSKPGIIIEVGTFLGHSAIAMAKYASTHGMDCAVICVDTWLGGIDHWLKEWNSLDHRLGRPTLYDRFLRNLKSSGTAEIAIPITLDSANAARYLEHHSIVADMVYVDGSHETGDVMRDLQSYWKLLKSGGIMIVDDVVPHFPGVVSDVRTFLEEIGTHEVESNGWKNMIRK